MPIEIRPVTKDEFIALHKWRKERSERGLVLGLKAQTGIRLVNHEHKTQSRSCQLAQTISFWGKVSSKTFACRHDGADLLVWRVK